MSSAVTPIATERLTIVPITAALAKALLVGERAAIVALLNWSVPDPFRLPPLLEDDLAAFVRALVANPDEVGWWGWLIGHRATLCGFAMCARPDLDDVSMLGWSLYPEARRRGFAAEAVTALMAWAAGTRRVTAFQATVPVELADSLRVAERVGLVRAGDQDVEGRRVIVLKAFCMRGARDRVPR